VLEKAGWIWRVGRGEYVCERPDDIIRSMVRFRVPDLLKAAGMMYAYSDASAVEIWTDFSYIQRSWEHSPYYVRVLKDDLRTWVEFFRRHRVKAFVGKAEPSLGEFVVLQPQDRLVSEERSGSPVEPLESVVRYCERNINSFEYPLAYLKEKFRTETKADIDRRVMHEAARTVRWLR
jgi:hypothetical protein